MQCVPALGLPTLPALPIALLALLLGCGGPSRHETLVREGRRAEASEQWVEAARLYERACQLEPKEVATCQRAVQMREYAVEIGSFRARALCAEGKLAECLTALQPVRSLQSSNQAKVMEVLEQASALAIAQCAPQGSGARALDTSLVEMRCLQGWREALWDTQSYRGHFAERSRYLSASLVGLAKAAPAEAEGARMSFLQAASCLLPASAAQQHELQRATASFLAGARIPLELSYTVQGTRRSAPGTCTDIAARLGRGLSCQDARTAHEALSLNAEVFSVEPRWQRSHSDRNELARYNDGTETLTNPEYERARVEYELADKRFRDIEADVRAREDRCNETQSDVDCNAFESIKRDSDRRRSEMESARSDFHSTPATITREIVREHQYTVRTHRWTAPYRATVRLGNAAAAPEVTSIVYTDTEQSGFAKAGIRADAFAPPVPTYFRDESSRWLVERLSDHIRAELSRRAKARMESCRGHRIDCWATANYWLGNTSFGAPLLEQLAPGEGALVCTAAFL